MKTFSRCLLSFASGLIVAPLALALGLAGCVSSKIDDSPIDSYRAAASERRDPEPTAESDQRGLENWKALLSDLSVGNIKGRANQVYSERTFFNDTLKTLRSGEAIEAYLIETAEMLDSGTVTYLDTAKSGDGGYYVRWEMIYRGSKLAGGSPIRTVGMSHLKFDADGRVTLHQDFWDASRGIFDHVPVVGPQLRWIKGRL